MRDNRERGRINLGALIGWIIFILIIAGGPLFSLLRRVSGGAISLSANILPILIGAMVVLSVIVSAVRALNNSARARGDTRLPTDAGTSPRSTNTPMPPFGGATGTSRGAPVPPPSPRGFTLPPSSRPVQMPQAPRFDPLINPAVLLIGVLGLLVLGGVALFALAGNIP